MRYMGMTNTSNRKGLPVKTKGPDQSAVRVAEDLVKTLQVLDATRVSLRKYVLKQATPHSQAPALAAVDKLIAEGARGLLQATEHVCAIDGIPLKLRREHVAVAEMFDRILADCGDIFKSVGERQ
ncbi:MAG: hypothetical protein KKH74_01480 [Gammaproteobacteria bacterium]|nr:hypothetical protein [Gammaproteobacteria bacterium]MBU1732495.1 hypothetical protein [Gammaproteobacteria bacterium]MBU1892631.1 hypothetical protein [Gammaproteobacteria bacterium]